MFELGVEPGATDGMARALAAESNGEALRRDVTSELHSALGPVQATIRTELMSMATAGLPTTGPPLRQTVLSEMRIEEPRSGESGATLAIGRTPQLRGFDAAGQALNRRGGWRHRVFGSRTSAPQMGKPGFFDRSTQQGEEKYKTGIRAALDKMARRIAGRVR